MSRTLSSSSQPLVSPMTTLRLAYTIALPITPGRPRAPPAGGECARPGHPRDPLLQMASGRPPPAAPRRDAAPAPRRARFHEPASPSRRARRAEADRRRGKPVGGEGPGESHGVSHSPQHGGRGSPPTGPAPPDPHRGEGGFHSSHRAPPPPARAAPRPPPR